MGVRLCRRACWGRMCSRDERRRLTVEVVGGGRSSAGCAERSRHCSTEGTEGPLDQLQCAQWKGPRVETGRGRRTSISVLWPGWPPGRQQNPVHSVSKRVNSPKLG